MLITHCVLFFGVQRVQSVIREWRVGVWVKKDGCVLRKVEQRFWEKAPALTFSCNNPGFVINQGQKRLINHNIHEAAATEWEWPWLHSQCAYASPGVKENQRGHSPGDLGQRHHPHLSQTSRLNQHLERQNHTLGNTHFQVEMENVFLTHVNDSHAVLHIKKKNKKGLFFLLVKQKCLVNFRIVW